MPPHLLGRVERLTGLSHPEEDPAHVRIALEEEDRDAARRRRLADVADLTDKTGEVRIAGPLEADDQIRRREFPLGLDVLAEIIEPVDRPVGLLERGDRPVLVDVRDVIRVCL